MENNLEPKDLVGKLKRFEELVGSVCRVKHGEFTIKDNADLEEIHKLRGLLTRALNYAEEKIEDDTRFYESMIRSQNMLYHMKNDTVLRPIPEHWKKYLDQGESD